MSAALIDIYKTRNVLGYSKRSCKASASWLRPNALHWHTWHPWRRGRPNRVLNPPTPANQHGPPATPTPSAWHLKRENPQGDNTMNTSEHRPLPRTVLRLHNAGMPISEIAWRLRRSPGHIRRILDWTSLPRPTRDPQDVAPTTSSPPNLRPLERRVLNAKQAGIDRAETASRLRRTPQHIARIEEYAATKLALLT